MSEELKFCKDCKHYMANGFVGLVPGSPTGYCQHNDNKSGVCLETGGAEGVMSPKECRSNEGRCGRSAKWFEARTSVNFELVRLRDEMLTKSRRWL